MKPHGIFVPGLYVSSKSSKYQCLKEGLAAELEFLDFASFHGKALSYNRLVAETEAALRSSYDFAVCYSLACNLYHHAVSRNRELEKPKVIFLTPPGQIMHAPRYRQFAASPPVDGIPHIPTTYHADGTHIPWRFFQEVDAASRANQYHRLTYEILVVLADQDEYVSTNILQEMESINACDVIKVPDNHRLKNSLEGLIPRLNAFIQ